LEIHADDPTTGTHEFGGGKAEKPHGTADIQDDHPVAEVWGKQLARVLDELP
jgi:hypothetical protein